MFNHLIEYFTYMTNLPVFLWTMDIIEISVHAAIVILVFINCLNSKKEPASTILWTFLTLSFPFFGALIYVVFAINRMPAKAFKKHFKDQKLVEERKSREDEALPLAYWKSVHETASSEADSPEGKETTRMIDAVLPDHFLLGGNLLDPLVDGTDTYPAMLSAISQAKDHIHLQSFIIKNDKIGNEFMALLSAKAREGVKVRILVDRFGSTHAYLTGMFSKYKGNSNLSIAWWTQANILKRQLQMNLRNHRKILVIDGKTAFFGGINIHDDHNGFIRDYHFRVSGPFVQELQFTFIKDWYYMTEENPEELLTERYFPHQNFTGSTKMRLINSGPTSHMQAISDVIFMSIVSAKRQIIMMTPYFVPPNDILSAIRISAMKGLDVRLIVPEKSNHFYVGHAGQSYYEDLLSCGVRVYQRKDPFLHAKAMVIDDRVCIIGTANMDNRSLKLNYETDVWVNDSKFAGRLKEIIFEDESMSTEINLFEWRKRPYRIKLMENISALMSPML